jgi:hypothetical protein
LPLVVVKFQRLRVHTKKSPDHDSDERMGKNESPSIGLEHETARAIALGRIEQPLRFLGCGIEVDLDDVDVQGIALRVQRKRLRRPQ